MADDFDQFYLDSRDRLALQVAALTGDPAEAHDHVQEAFIRAWTQWDRISQYDDPEAWVRRVACNQAISRWRRARRLIVRADAGAEVAQFSRRTSSRCSTRCGAFRRTSGKRSCCITWSATRWRRSRARSARRRAR